MGRPSAQTRPLAFPTERAASRGASPAADNPPPLEPIQTLEAADKVLAELAFLDATEAELKAECDRQLLAVRAQFAGKMNVTINGREMPIADRRREQLARLEFAVRRYRPHWLESDDNDNKSRVLNHGEFGFRDNRARLEDVPLGKAAAKAFAGILDTIVLLARRALKTMLFARGDSGCLRLQITLDRQAILTAAKNGEITPDELKRVGLKYVPSGAEETFFAKPKAAEVQSQSAAAPAPEAASCA